MTYRRRTMPQVGILIGFLLAAAVAGCGKPPPPYAWHVSADSLRGQAVRFQLPSSAVRNNNMPRKGPLQPLQGAGAASVVHPLVRAMVDSMPGDTGVFFVTFRENRDLRRYRSIPRAELPDSLFEPRKTSIDEAMTLAAPTVAADVVILETFWLIRGALIGLPHARVDSLAMNPEIISIEPEWIGSAPLCLMSSSHVLDVVEEYLGTAHFAAEASAGGNIALLDTGVHVDHTLLDNGRIDRLIDCVDEECEDVTVDEYGDLSDEGHGTASAAILMGGPPKLVSRPFNITPVLPAVMRERPIGLGFVGMAYLDLEDRGLTRGHLASYRVFGEVTEDGSTVLRINTAGAVRAFEAAVAESDFDDDGVAGDDVDIIVAVMQDELSAGGSLTSEVNSAFQLGVLTVVAGGNDGSTLAAPAAAAMTLGVGAWCLGDESFYSTYSRGTTTDRRYKPDLTAPTDSYTAGSPREGMQNYGGTSGATPFAGAVGLILQNWITTGISERPAPEVVYALMLLTAQERDAGDVLCEDVDGVWTETEPVNWEGAGRIFLPQDGDIEWGEVVWAREPASGSVFDPDEMLTMTLSVDGSSETQVVEAVIWWPETNDSDGGMPALDQRSDFDLEVRSSSETATSASCGNVWERAGIEVSSSDDVEITIWASVVAEGREIPVTWATWVRPR